MGLLDALISLLYPGRQYGTRAQTRAGVEVRSRAESRIADYFDQIQLRYEYEKELRAGFWIFQRKISRPDFYLPDHDVYVEYWGLLDAEDADDRERYERSMKYKLARYHELGVKCISLYPRDLNNLDWTFRTQFQKVTGNDLPR